MTRYTRDTLAAVSVAFATYFAAIALLPRSTASVGYDLSDSLYFGNCNEARAAGEAPIYRGEPGFRDELDRDGDGVACEPYYER